MGTINPHPYTQYKAKCIQYKCIQYIIVRTEYEDINIGGLTAGAEMA